MPKSSWLTKLGRRVTPSRYRPKVKGYLLKVGMVGSPYRLFAYLYGIVILQTLAIYLLVIYPMLTAPVLDLLVVEIECTPMVTVLVSVVLVCVMYICLKYLVILIVKYYLDILIFKRTKKIEEVLPYYLHGVAVNLKSGMEFNHALLHAVEPEYSVLEKEIEMVAKKEMSGKDLQQALREFADKYNSPILKEVIDLINTGLKGGSNIAGSTWPVPNPDYCDFITTKSTVIIIEKHIPIFAAPSAHGLYRIGGYQQVIHRLNRLIICHILWTVM